MYTSLLFFFCFVFFKDDQYEKSVLPRPVPVTDTPDNLYEEIIYEDVRDFQRDYNSLNEIT